MDKKLVVSMNENLFLVRNVISLKFQVIAMQPSMTYCMT